MQTDQRPKKIIDIWVTSPKGGIDVFSANGIQRMNGVAALIWQDIDGVRTINEIIERVIVRYPTVDRSLIAVDIGNILKTLDALELIVLNWKPL